MSGRVAATTVNGHGRYDEVRLGGSGEGLSYSALEPEVLCELIEAVTGAGDGILFARTVDGGALSIRVLSSGNVSKFYPSHVAELELLVDALIRAART